MTGSEKNKIILFDFDGVLVDSFEAAYSINAVMNFGLNRDEYRDLFMGNIYNSIKKFVADEERDNHDQEWFANYNKLLMVIDPIEGTKELLEELSKKYTMVIISSSVQSCIHAYLEKYDLHHYFDIVLGADVHDSKVHKIQMIFDKYNVEADNCVFITDTVGDLLEAEKKNVKTIAVTWGFHEKERFNNTPPHQFVNSSKELREAIINYLQ